MGPDSVSNLQIWKESISIVKEVYAQTRAWPKDELYGLTSQVRRAAVSIPANLAEGVGRGTPKEAARFAQIALGSLYELDTLLHLGGELELSPLKVTDGIRERLVVLSRRISSYVRYQASVQTAGVAD